MVNVMVGEALKVWKTRDVGLKGDETAATLGKKSCLSVKVNSFDTEHKAPTA